MYLRVEELVHTEKPQVHPNSSLNDVIIEISSKRLGTTVVLDKDAIVGLITDGDLRRMLQTSTDLKTVLAKDIMSVMPKSIQKDALAAEALAIMELHNITQLIAIDNDVYIVIIHLHDILKEGIL